MTSQYSILVADDDPSMRRLLVRVAQFVDPNILVVEAPNGTEALSALQGRSFTVVITDYHMPGINGLDVVMAAHAQAPARPIIVVSAEEEVEPAVLAAGASVFIAKPFAVERFAAILRGFLTAS